MSKRWWFYLFLLAVYFPVMAGLAVAMHDNGGFANEAGKFWVCVWSWYAWILAKRKFPDPKVPPVTERAQAQVDRLD